MSTAAHTGKQHSAHIHRSASDRWAKIIAYLIVGLFGLMCLYPLLLTVTVSGKLPDGWEKKETHTKYTLHTVSGGTHVIELSDYDGMHDAVTLDGHTYFYLIKGGMTELPE